jgi:adenylate kinase
MPKKKSPFQRKTLTRALSRRLISNRDAIRNRLQLEFQSTLDADAALSRDSPS